MQESCHGHPTNYTQLQTKKKFELIFIMSNNFKYVEFVSDFGAQISLVQRYNPHTHTHTNSEHAFRI